MLGGHSLIVSHSNRLTNSDYYSLSKMLQQLMQERQCDAPDAIIKATHKLISKYKSIITRYDMTGDKLINFLAKHNPKYKQIVDEYLASYN